MRFDLVHETGNRQRWRTRSTVTLASANLIADEVSAIDGIDGVTMNPRTGSLIVTFSKISARKKLASYLVGLIETPPILRDSRKEAASKVTQTLREQVNSLTQIPHHPLAEKASQIYRRSIETMPVLSTIRNVLQNISRTSTSASDRKDELDFAPLVRWVIVRPILPILVNIANAVLGAIPYLLKGIKELAHGRLNVEVLDATAIGISLLRRDFKTAGLVVLLLGLGEMLERYTRKKSMDSLADQLALKVDQVWIRRNGVILEIALKDLQEDDVVVVHAGNTIPVDGVVVAGDASVNQATMTGEAIPVHRTLGGTVFAGTVIEDGEIDIRPTGLGDETRLNQIIRFIENSEQSKANLQGKAERLADAIVPYNFALAALIFILTRDLTRTASILLVDYSCALRLSTPLAILTAMKHGIMKGTLIKGGRYLEALSEVDTVVFDKTGTLTQATPKLSDIIPLDKTKSSDEILCLAACLEEHFPHPVSHAIVNAAKEKELAHFNEVHDAEVKYIVAHGICSTVDGVKVLIGSKHFIEEDEGIDVQIGEKAVDRLAREGKSILYMAYDGRLIGVLGITDPLREEAVEVITALRARGIKHIVMLTGDDNKTAKTVASKLGIDDYRAQVLPSEKADYVQMLKEQGAKVLMVGDGINDSPALSCSDVGITLQDGSAIAQEVADVVLTKNSLKDLPVAIDLSRMTMKRIKTNFTLSVGLNSIFMLGGLTGLLMPATGAVLHNMTTIGVCLNAMRSPMPVTSASWYEQVVQALTLTSQTN